MHPNAHSSPAMLPVPAVAAPAAPAVSGAVMCAVSLAASRPLQIQVPKISLPKISLPQLPNLDLPNFGKKKEGGAKASDAVQEAPKAAPPVGKVKIRASSVVQGDNNLPSAAELSGRPTVKSIGSGEGFKRYPSRRMPGANMEGWKNIARDIGPKM